MTDETVNPQDLEKVRDSCLRHGMSREDADQVIETCVLECREGDTRLLEFLREKAIQEIH